MMHYTKIKDLLDAIWNDGKTPMLLIDARHKDVIIPEHIREKWKEALAINLKAADPLNIVFTETAIEVDLAFNHTLMRCTLPWHRIYSIIISGTNQGFRLQAEPGLQQPKASEEEAPKRGWKPRVIKGGKSN